MIAQAFWIVKEERNEIEKKAIVAVKHLADVVFFLFDPTQPYAPQKWLFDYLKKLFNDKEFVVGLTKLDIASPPSWFDLPYLDCQKVEEVKETLSKKALSNYRMRKGL